jgi:hypothetical protein
MCDSERTTRPAAGKLAPCTGGGLRTMFAELFDDNQALARRLNELRRDCRARHGITTAGLIGVWIDGTE